LLLCFFVEDEDDVDLAFEEGVFEVVDFAFEEDAFDDEDFDFEPELLELELDLLPDEELFDDELLELDDF